MHIYLGQMLIVMVRRLFKKFEQYFEAWKFNDLSSIG